MKLRKGQLVKGRKIHLNGEKLPFLYLQHQTSQFILGDWGRDVRAGAHTPFSQTPRGDWGRGKGAFSQTLGEDWG